MRSLPFSQCARRASRLLAALFVAAASLTVGLSASTARAAADLLGTRAIGMGGALRAAPTGESSVLLNPAGMSLSKSYVISALYQFRVADSASLVNVSIVDSVTVSLAAGLYYSFAHASPTRTLALPQGGTVSLEETIQNQEVGLALSYPIAGMFHLGATTKYVRQSVEQSEGTPAALARDTISTVTMDFGGIFQPTPSWHIGVVGYNVIPVADIAYPRKLGLGVAYAPGTRFLAAFDTVLDFTTLDRVQPSFHGGAELFLGSMYALRGGVLHDRVQDATYVTAGLGLVTSRLALEAALRQMVEGGAETLLAFSVRLFLEAGAR